MHTHFCDGQTGRKNTDDLLFIAFVNGFSEDNYNLYCKHLYIIIYTVTGESTSVG